MRAVIYARYSSDNQREESIENDTMGNESVKKPRREKSPFDIVERGTLLKGGYYYEFIRRLRC